jgi:hypothetical protein
MAYNLWRNVKGMISAWVPGGEDAPEEFQAVEEALTEAAASSMAGQLAGSGYVPPSDEPPGFLELDELDKLIARYSYSASRSAYAPFFTQAGRRGSGQRDRIVDGRERGKGGAARHGPAPTLGVQQSPFRGMAQALGASVPRQSGARTSGRRRPTLMGGA